MTAGGPLKAHFRNLPRVARVFVAGTIILAGMVVVTHLPTLANVPLFIALALASSLASAMKVRLPLGAGSSNLSVSYTVDFAALLLLGPNPTMIVAALSALTQSTFRTARRNPLYRVLFSVAALILTVQAAGWMFLVLGGRVGVFDTDLIKPLVAAALAYYVLNTSTMAGAVGL